MGMCVKPNIFNSILIWGWGIFLGCAYKTQHFQFYPNIRSKHLWCGNICLGCVQNPTFLIFSRNLCQTFGGWKHISRMYKKKQYSQFYPKICVKHLGAGNIFLGCVRNPTFSILSRYLCQNLGVGNIYLGCVKTRVNRFVNIFSVKETLNIFL